MEFKHKSVLFDECMEGLNIKPDGIYVDGTLGGGGHSSGICELLGPEGVLIGIDRDQDALNAASKRLEKYNCQKIFVQSNYSDIAQVLEDLEIDEIDGALLDLGVSSFQLDNPERGFSYMNDAPLDMRMSQDDSFTAYDVVNEYDELVDVIKAAIPASARRTGPHPAKRTFQAIRIEVNDELGQLERAVEEFCDVLAPKGRLCIITFHSLEDRIVKDIFNQRANPCTCPKEFPMCVCGKKPDIKKVTGKPIIPSEAELEEKPRARSAKLRVAQKIK